jgi:ATP-dependent Clp protease ATP-binding subunit ClpA
MPGRYSFAEDNRFDKFTERARKTLVLAQQEAQQLGHNYIGTEHLLLGLVGLDDGVAVVVLRNMGVSRDRVRDAIIHIIGHGDRLVLGEVGLTPRAKKVLQLGVDEARRMNHHYIGTEHILLGLVREGDGIAAKVLEDSFGLKLSAIRAETLRVLSQYPSRSEEGAEVESPEPRPQPGGGPKNNVITCRLDDRSLDALDTLVEAGVRATRSDAAAWLIAAGIDSHQELFARLASTIQTIRQLRQEAQAIANEVVSSPAAGAEPTPPAGGTAEPPQPRADQEEGAVDDSTPKRGEDADGGDGVA